MNIRRKVNFYRSTLDPRDPDYEDPMESEDEVRRTHNMDTSIF